MESLINKIQNILKETDDKINDYIIINKISKLKGTRFTRNISVKGKGIISKIAADVRGNATDILTLIIDEDEITKFQIGYDGIYHNTSLGYVFILDKPIPFNKRFAIQTRSDNTLCSVIYTLEQEE